MGRKKKHPEHENHERWLVSYADFITLLFAFFTTMYAVSNVDAQKMGRMVLSMQAAFDASVFPAASSTLGMGAPKQVGGDQPTVLESVRPLGPQPKRISDEKGEKGKPSLETVKARLDQMITERQLEGKLRLSLDRRGLIVRLAEVGFYDSGSSDVKPEGMDIIDLIAREITVLENDIRIEGHTDNIPIKTSRYPSNWELSTARATNIVILLQNRYQIDPQRLSASGYGEFRPLAPNDTAQNRGMNRRVDIILLNKETGQQEPPTLPAAPDEKTG